MNGISAFRSSFSCKKNKKMSCKALKKLKAEGSYYRIRIGNCRIGIIISDDTVIFIRVLNRREIYRYFP